MGKPLTPVATPAMRKVRTPRAAAVLELDSVITDLHSSSEQATLMAEDLVGDFFLPYSEEVHKEGRDVCILFYFEEYRVRAEILTSLLYKIRDVAKSLDAELRKAARGE